MLADFAGTILLVSHDRYLIDALATQIWALSPGKLDVYKGQGHEYIAAGQAAAAAAAETTRTKNAEPARVAEKKHGLNPHQLQKRLEELETLIPQLEQRLDDLTAAIGTASANADAERVRTLGEQYTQAEADLHATMQAWEQLLD